MLLFAIFVIKRVFKKIKLKLISDIKKELTIDIINNEEIKIIEYLKKDFLFKLKKPEI